MSVHEQFDIIIENLKADRMMHALRWIHLQRFAGAIMLGYVVLAAITLFIGGIALRSLVALWQGKFLPAPAVT